MTQIADKVDGCKIARILKRLTHGERAPGTIGHLFRGNFIRASIWACIGFGMLCWWQGENTIPDPWNFHAWLTNSGWVAGLGVLATFLRWRKKQQVMQAIPTMPTWTPPAEAIGNIAPIIEVEYKRLPN